MLQKCSRTLSKTGHAYCVCVSEVFVSVCVCVVVLVGALKAYTFKNQ